MLTLASKACIECGSVFKGRIDKKFCSNQCRSTFHNRLQSSETTYMKKVNSILRKNRRILMKLIQEGTTAVDRGLLANAGFDFTYFTSLQKDRDGRHFFYCYDQGYCRIENDDYILVIKRKL